MTELTPKQEAFVLNYFRTGNASEAYRVAGYKLNPNLDAIAHQYLVKPCVQARLFELRAQAGLAAQADKEIADELERKKILTKIARHGVETPVTAGNVIQAISEHNKMEGVYEEKSGYQDKRVINIIVSSEKAKELTENVGRRLLGRVVEGKG